MFMKIIIFWGTDVKEYIYIYIYMIGCCCRHITCLVHIYDLPMLFVQGSRTSNERRELLYFGGHLTRHMRHRMSLVQCCEISTIMFLRVFHLPVNLSITLSIYSIYIYIYIYVCVCVWALRSIYQSVYLSIYSYIYIYIYK